MGDEWFRNYNVRSAFFFLRRMCVCVCVCGWILEALYCLIKGSMGRPAVITAYRRQEDPSPRGSTVVCIVVAADFGSSRCIEKG